jgi:hypothetical protein
MLVGDLNALVLILGCILAMSGIIIAKKPDARALIEKLTPYQTLIGIALIVLGVINFFVLLPKLTNIFKLNLISAAVALTVVGTSILLGALFGMPQIAKLIPDQNAEQKALRISQQLAPYQVMLGLVGLVASVLYFLYRFKLISFSG